MDIHRGQKDLQGMEFLPAIIMVVVADLFFYLEFNSFSACSFLLSIGLVGLFGQWNRIIDSFCRSFKPALVLIAVLFSAQTIAFSQPTSAAQESSRSARSQVSISSSDRLKSLANRLEESLALSRPILLGSRDPSGPSCVAVVTKGQVYNLGFDNFLDPNGGPGTSIFSIYYIDRQNVRSPMMDFNWFQGRLKTYLQNQAVLNNTAGFHANAVAQQALEFYELTKTWTALPEDLVGIDFNVRTDWASYCLSKLNNAIHDRDLERTQRWAGELAGATFALSDLHRWLGFLVENHLNAVEFQKRCQELFERSEKLGKTYDPMQTVSNFPAGVLTGNSLSNYYEVERQAEQLFSVPAARLETSTNKPLLVPELIWIPPEHREAYLEWRSELGAQNKKTLDLAAKSPYHRTYLVNMLFRYESANTVSRMGDILNRFDAVSPNSDVNELMDVLMYRAHSFAGLEWDDRFQPELITAGKEIDSSKSPVQAFLAATSWTNKFFDPKNYGLSFTLREAIMRRKLDCVRATDMIGTIFRNSGRSRFGHIRWCAEFAGHSVAAYLGVDNNETRTLITDGLIPPSEPEVWPDAYFRGHDWPPNLVDSPPPFAVELYGRGLNSYVWLEGYIISGPNAGQLTTAAIPYLEGRHEYSTRKVFDGPYPQ